MRSMGIFAGESHEPQVEEGVAMIEDVRPGVEAHEADYVEFHRTGDAAKGEFRCAECGYGVAVVKTLPPCPMCGGGAWEQSTWSPFTRASRELQ